MAAANDVSTLNGLFKTVYADKLLDLVPDFAILQKRIDFVGADKETGSYYAQPVNLAGEGGFSYLGESPVVTALNSAIAGTMKEAQVKGSEMVLRAQLEYGALARASKAGPKAFKRASAWKVEDMNNSMRKRLEIAMLYGRTGIGVVASVSSNVVTITDATWAGGIWAGTEGHIVEFYSGITGSDTKRSSADGTITAVDSDNKTITVTDATGVTAGDYIFFKGARTASAFNEMAGLQKILSNSSTLFNIDASAYSLWKGNSVDASSEALTQALLDDTVARCVNKGLMSKLLCITSPKGWSRLNVDQAALRVFDSSYSGKKAENGSEALTFHSTNGTIEVLSHPFVKEGDTFLVAEDELMRIGSVDLSFGVPGMDQQFFTLVQGYNAVELQCMADQAIFIEKPAHNAYISGITFA